MNRKDNKMKKKYLWVIVIIIVLLGLGAGAYFVFLKPDSKSSNNSSSSSTNPAQQQGQPTRAAEIKGYVKSIEGNEVVVINEISTEPELTDAEKAAQKAERQSMSQEERQALKAEESAGLQKEDVKIIIPVGITIKKTTGDASGNLVDAQLTDIKEGTYVSLWVKDYKTNNQMVEFAKVRGATE